MSMLLCTTSSSNIILNKTQTNVRVKVFLLPFQIWASYLKTLTAVGSTWFISKSAGSLVGKFNFQQLKLDDSKITQGN